MNLIEYIMLHLYFLGTLIASIPFFILFYFKKECRKGMVLTGTFAGVAAFLFSHISVYDYWHPVFMISWLPIEDFLYGFFFGGFVSECADIFLKHKFKKNNNRKVYLLSFTFISPVITYVGVNVFHLNSIIILFIFAIIIAFFSFVFNHHIIRLQLLSGLIALLVTFIIFQILLLIDPHFILNSWKLHNLSGIILFKIPIEEYIFAFLLGFCITHFYEIVIGKDVRF